MIEIPFQKFEEGPKSIDKEINIEGMILMKFYLFIPSVEKFYLFQSYVDKDYQIKDLINFLVFQFKLKNYDFKVFRFKSINEVELVPGNQIIKEAVKEDINMIFGFRIFALKKREKIISDEFFKYSSKIQRIYQYILIYPIEKAEYIKEQTDNSCWLSKKAKKFLKFIHII